MTFWSLWRTTMARLLRTPGFYAVPLWGIGPSILVGTGWSVIQHVQLPHWVIFYGIAAGLLLLSATLHTMAAHVQELVWPPPIPRNRRRVFYRRLLLCDSPSSQFVSRGFMNSSAVIFLFSSSFATIVGIMIVSDSDIYQAFKAAFLPGIDRILPFEISGLTLLLFFLYLVGFFLVFPFVLMEGIAPAFVFLSGTTPPSRRSWLSRAAWIARWGYPLEILDGLGGIAVGVVLYHMLILGILLIYVWILTQGLLFSGALLGVSRLHVPPDDSSPVLAHHVAQTHVQKK
ncbi:hypothetical protein [Sulfobacillus thermosulfidooxidans]|uniref:hypothetical protein n=1 Tax=Sulfobacillus thermosulfidooxidans TaxID=28034 RepID=UPI0006B4A641|nr:hypothetical protein [Sulfobacillus thermosulfidooxidans]